MIFSRTALPHLPPDRALTGARPAPVARGPRAAADGRNVVAEHTADWRDQGDVGLRRARGSPLGVPRPAARSGLDHSDLAAQTPPAGGGASPAQCRVGRCSHRPQPIGDVPALRLSAVQIGLILSPTLMGGPGGRQLSAQRGPREIT